MDTDSALLARLDERTKSISEKVDTLANGMFVTNDEFKPIKMLVYGQTGIILAAVAGAILKQVMT